MRVTINNNLFVTQLVINKTESYKIGLERLQYSLAKLEQKMSEYPVIRAAKVEYYAAADAFLNAHESGKGVKKALARWVSAQKRIEELDILPEELED